MSIKHIRLNEGTVVIGLLMLIACSSVAVYFLFIAPKSQIDTNADEPVTPTKINPTFGTPPEIKSNKDLESATKDLDQTSMDDTTDLNKLDQEMLDL